MPNMLTVEEEEKDLPILCIVGEASLLRDEFIKEKQKEFKLIVVSSKKPDFEIQNLYYLPYSDSAVLPHLEESIDYALLFLEDAKIKEFLTPIVMKLTKDNAKSTFLIKATAFETFYDVMLETKKTASFYYALVGEILTKNYDKNSEKLSTIINVALQKKEIRLNGNDLQPVYPITLADAFSGIQKLLFGKTKHNALYFMFYKHPETILATTHILSRIEPDIKVLFSEAEQVQKPPFGRDDMKEFIQQKLQMEGVFLDEQFEGFEAGVAQLMEPEEQGVEETTKKWRPGKITIHPKVVRGGSILFTSFLLGVVLFLFVQGVAFLAGAFYLREAIHSIEKEHYVEVASNAKKASFFFQIIKPTVYIASDFTRFADRENNILKTFQLIERSLSLSELAGNTITTMSQKNLNKNDIEALVAQFSFLYQEGERIKLEENNKVLQNVLKPEYSKLLSISQTFPFILGYNSEKTYLLLLQNNGELRPTGGFIGSVGELKVKNGEIENLTIQDVYEYDGQLKNHIEPPFIVRRYLQPHLYLRDSNFFPDFQETASTAAKIYNLETKKVPDGIIAVNFEVLKQILHVTGPINLPEYKTTITDKNVFDYLQTTIDTNFFPGSTQKKDVLTALFNTLLTTVEEKPQTWLSIAKLLPTLMEDKNIMFSYQERAIQKIFNANGYGGELTDKRKRESKTMYDFLSINEANIGVNKANIQITRNVSYDVLLGEETVRSTASITLNNPPGNKDYKTYLQFIVPRGSKLTKILINGQEQSKVAAITDPKIYEGKTFKAPEGLEVEEYVKNNNTYFAFVTTVKAGESSVISVIYDNGARKSLTSRTSYSLLYIKQAGTPSYQFSSTIYYPENYEPDKTEASSFGKNFIRFDDKLSKDNEYNITLQRKSN